MKVLLDSSFIVSCVKKKIDFLAQLEEQGFTVVVPREVMQELKDLALKSRRPERDAIGLAFQLFEHAKTPVMTLGHRSVDAGLIKAGQNGYYIATLDRAIKRAVPLRVILSSAGRRVGPE